MKEKSKNFVDKFAETVGAQLEKINNNSTSQRTLAELAGINKSTVSNIYKGEFMSFRVLVALMAVILESRGARLDDENGQMRDDIHRFFVALEQSFRECLDAYENTPDFAPGTHFGQIGGSTHPTMGQDSMGENVQRMSRLVALLEDEIKRFHEQERNFTHEPLPRRLPGLDPPIQVEYVTVPDRYVGMDYPAYSGSRERKKRVYITPRHTRLTNPIKLARKKALEEKKKARMEKRKALIEKKKQVLHIRYTIPKNRFR